MARQNVRKVSRLGNPSVTAAEGNRIVGRIGVEVVLESLIQMELFRYKEHSVRNAVYREGDLCGPDHLLIFGVGRPNVS